MLRRLAILLALTAPMALWAGAFDGRYRPAGDWAQNWDCRSIGTTGGAMAITNDTFIGIEIRCSMRQPTAIRDMDATIYEMICRRQGGTWTERMIFMPGDGGIIVIRNGGDVTYLTRCE